MGEFNIIQRPDLILRLQTMLGIRQAHVVPSLAETVQPVVIFGDVRDTGGERQIVRPAWGGDLVGPTAPFFPVTLVRNPTGSRAIVTVRRVLLCNPNGAAGTPGDRQFFLGVANFFGGGLTTPAAIPPEFRHSRAIDPSPASATPSNNLPVAQISSDLGVAAFTNPLMIIANGNEQITFDCDIALAPGWGLTVGLNGNGVANSVLRTGFLWEEEDLEQRG